MEDRPDVLQHPSCPICYTRYQYCLLGSCTLQVRQELSLKGSRERSDRPDLLLVQIWGVCLKYALRYGFPILCQIGHHPARSTVRLVQ